MDIVIGILTIMGVALILYWGVAAVNVEMEKIRSCQPFEKVEVPAFLTVSRGAFVKQALFDPLHNKYIAEVKCPKLKDRSLPVAGSLDELWLLCRERISDFEKEISSTDRK